MVTVEQIAHTFVRPAIVDQSGIVRAFYIGKSNLAMSGDFLRIGIDGEVYVVFPDSATADIFYNLFCGCRLACFGNAHNAYHIPTVH